MSKPLDVVGLGAAIVDIVARIDDAFLEQHDIPKGGMTLVDHVRADAIYSAMGPATEISGGSAANTIAGIAALGGAVQFVGKTKDDQLGEIFRHDIRAAGAAFSTAALPRDTPGATARSMILVTPDAERSMCTDLGVSNQVSDTDLPLDALADAKVVYLEGYLWDREETKAAFRAAMKAVKEAGGSTALTLSDAFCVDRHRASFREIVQGDVDILFANESELLSLYEVSSLDDAIARVGQEVALAAVTQSEKGVSVVCNGTRIDVSTEEVPEVIDTTGAGDLFASGFLYGHVTGCAPELCARMGNTAAGAVIQHLGARPQADLRAVFQAKGLLT